MSDELDNNETMAPVEGVHEVREEISQALSAYLQSCDVDEQSTAGFADFLAARLQDD